MNEVEIFGEAGGCEGHKAPCIARTLHLCLGLIPILGRRRGDTAPLLTSVVCSDANERLGGTNNTFFSLPISEPYSRAPPDVGRGREKVAVFSYCAKTFLQMCKNWLLFVASIKSAFD